MKHFIALLASFAVLSLTACGGSSPAPTSTSVSLGSAVAGTYTVELLADAALGTGAHAIYARVTATATGLPVTDAGVAIRPTMNVGAMQHGCPVTGPFERDATTGLYRTGVVFQMAGTWSATVTLTPAGGSPVAASFPALVVTDTGHARSFAVGSGMAATSYVLSMDFVRAPVVGLNPIAVRLYSSSDTGVTFTPVDDASIALDPWMPSMGHGSSGSVNPTLVANGLYEGKVSFSMAGTWETRVTVSRAGVALASSPAQPVAFTTVLP